MNPDFHYQVFWNGKAVQQIEICKGTLMITLPAKTGIGKLEIRKAN
jgi:hypothetical protein